MYISLSGAGPSRPGALVKKVKLRTQQGRGVQR